MASRRGTPQAARTRYKKSNTTNPNHGAATQKYNTARYKQSTGKTNCPTSQHTSSPYSPTPTAAATATVASTKTAYHSTSHTCNASSPSTSKQASYAAKQAYPWQKYSTSWYHAAGFCQSHPAPNSYPSAAPSPTTYTAKTTTAAVHSAATSPASNSCAQTASASPAHQTKIASFSAPPLAA